MVNRPNVNPTIPYVAHEKCTENNLYSIPLEDQWSGIFTWTISRRSDMVKDVLIRFNFPPTYRGFSETMVYDMIECIILFIGDKRVHNFSGKQIYHLHQFLRYE